MHSYSAYPATSRWSLHLQSHTGPVRLIPSNDGDLQSANIYLLCTQYTYPGFFIVEPSIAISVYIHASPQRLMPAASAKFPTCWDDMTSMWYRDKEWHSNLSRHEGRHGQHMIIVVQSYNRQAYHCSAPYHVAPNSNIWPIQNSRLESQHQLQEPPKTIAT